MKAVTSAVEVHILDLLKVSLRGIACSVDCKVTLLTRILSILGGMQDDLSGPKVWDEEIV